MVVAHLMAQLTITGDRVGGSMLTALRLAFLFLRAPCGIPKRLVIVVEIASQLANNPRMA
jgi:hypothetical protein